MRFALFLFLVAGLSLATDCYNTTGKLEDDQKVIDALSPFQAMVTRITAHNQVSGFSAVVRVCSHCPAPAPADEKVEPKCSVYAELENGKTFLMEAQRSR